MQKETTDTTHKGKKKRYTYNTLIVNHLQKKHGVSKVYIRLCLNGSKKSILADVLKKEYEEYSRRIAEILK